MALELNLSGGERQHAGDQIEGRALARAIGADQSDDAAALDLEADIVDRDQSAKCFSRALRLQQRRSRRRQWTVRQLLIIARRRWRRCGRRAEQDRPQSAGSELQDQHQHRAECDGFEIAGIADQPGQEILQLVAQHRNSGGAENGAVDAAGAAQHRHQQIFGAGADAERARRYRALEMRVEPSGQACEHRGIDEHHQLGGGGIDAERLGGAGGAPQRADGAADASAEQVLRRDHRKHHRDPDHHEIFTWDGSAHARRSATEGCREVRHGRRAS